MPLKVEREPDRWRLRLDEDCCLSSAVELKALLQEALASDGEVHLDFEQAGEIDVSVLQLLWAAGRELEPSGRAVLSASERVLEIARGAGFDRLPCEREAATAPQIMLGRE